MLLEPTTLAAIASAIVEGLDAYGCDAEPLFRKAGLDMGAMSRPGARYSMRRMTRLWELVRDETGDPCVGLVVGQKVRPPALHALGLAWISSPTLLDGLQRLERYAHVTNTALSFEIVQRNGEDKLCGESESGDLTPRPEAVDAALAIIVSICRKMQRADFAPRRVTFMRADNGHTDRYIEFFKAPVFFAQPDTALYFDSQALREPLPAGNLELALENDRVAERYLATLDPDLVQDKVREMLVALLPAGTASQEAVARRLNRSVSSLQRQLKAEGVSYRRILDETRLALAQQLVRDGSYPLSEIAFLLGFSDQGNFTRAFKRWTGETPKRYRGAAAP